MRVLFLMGLALWHVASSEQMCGTPSASIESHREAFTRVSNEFSLALFRTVSSPGSFVIAHYSSFINLLKHWKTQVQKALDQERLAELRKDFQTELCLKNTVADRFNGILGLGYYTMARKMFSNSGADRSPSPKDRTSGYGNSKKLAEAVNEWTRKKTNCSYDLLKSGEVSNETAAVIVDITYFKGRWEKQFEIEPRDNYEPPYVSDERPYFMYSIGNFRTGHLYDHNATFCVIPYKSNGPKDAMSMVILLPNESSNIDELEKSIDKISLDHILSQPKLQAYVRMPVFRIDTTIQKTITNPELGAVLTGIFSPSRRHPKNVTTFTKVVIEVDEQGASDMDDEMGKDHSNVTYFWVDRPFICLIVTNTNPTLLFSARLVRPVNSLSLRRYFYKVD